MKKTIASIVMSILSCLLLFANGVKDTGSGKLVFWDKSEYVAAYNKASQARFEQFGKEHNIEIEYVIVPPNDLKQKLLAAIEAGNPPDLVVTDDFLGKQFAGMGQLVDIADINSAINFTKAGRDVAYVSNGNYVIPLALLAPGFYIRSDKWEEKGLKLPTTWQELYETAKIVNDPAHDFYALGYPMGDSGGGDAEGMCRAVILAFGGIPVDKNGRVTVNSKETLEALKFIAKLYKEKLCPPSAITWDDMGNNTAFMAGSVGVIQNAASVFSQLKRENPSLYSKTKIMNYPSGPAGSFTLGGGNVICIFKRGKNTAAAKEYVKYFFDKKFYSDLLIQMGGMWQPTIDGVTDNEFWKRPENAGWLASSQNVVPNTYPAPATDLTTKAFSMQLCVKSVQKIVLKNTDPQQALNELEADLKRVLGQ